MTDLVKTVSFNVVKDWENRFAKTGEPMDICPEFANAFARNILNVAFGEDIIDYTLPYISNGVTSTKTVGYVIRECAQICFTRNFTLQILLFPESYKWYIT
jgi:hypothetical protein